MNKKIQAVEELTHWIDAQIAPRAEKILMLHYLELISGISWLQFIFNKDKGRDGSTD